MREFQNSEKNGLGLPLPKGRTRFYRKDDSDGRIEFVGEDTIDHTAKNELVRVKTGDAFDLVGERVSTNQASSNFQRQAEQAWEIRLRNRKAEAVEVRIVEHLYGPNWSIHDNTDPFTKKDANTVEFRVKLQPDSVRAVNYRVTYDWK